MSVHAAPSADTSPGSWVRFALTAARGPRTRRAASVVTAGLAVWEVARQARKVVAERLLFTVAVPATDEIYDALHVWLVAQVPASRRRSVLALTAPRSAGDVPVGVPTSTQRPSLREVYDGTRTQTIMVGGHRVQVAVERDSRLDGVSLTVNRDDSWIKPLQRIVFSCTGVAAREAVMVFLAEFADLACTEERAPRVWTAARWGGWRHVQNPIRRPIDTVVLPDGMLPGIVADLQAFYAQEEAYARVGLPWHRGYLFHGQPGCGKTSAARALADEFRLDVYYLPLADIDADTNLVEMLADVPARAMLLIEDIDVVHAARSRTDDAKKVSMSGLLNALDGIVTTHGLLTVMTTNHIEALDPALTRPGRADLTVEFGMLDDDQAARLADLAAPGTSLPPLDGARLTHAELLEAAKPYLLDPDRAGKAMAAAVYEARP